MLQTYYCNHCGMNCETIFSVFLHIFTDHMHVDIGLGKDESSVLVNKMKLYRIRVSYFWPN
jgi:hypothetical protein